MSRYKTGTVLAVDVDALGDTLAADATAGAMSIFVDDAADFELGDETSGQLLLNDVVYTYTDVDDDTGEITLTSGLEGDAEDADDVFVWDPLYEVVSTDKSADVRLHDVEQGGDPIYAVFAQHLVEKLGEGIRGVRGETVLLERDRGEWRIVDVLGFGDPDAGLGGSVRFWDQDTFTVEATGEQELTLTYPPIPGSLHMAWCGVWQPHTEFSNEGRTVTIPDPDGLLEVDDTIDFRYAYRVGDTRIETEVPDPWLLLPAGVPDLNAGLGTTGPSASGSGDIWIDGDPATGVTLFAVDNPLGRDNAIIQLPSNTNLPTDDDGLQLRLYITIEGGGTPYQDFTVRLVPNSDGTGVIILNAVSSSSGSIELVMSGSVQDFLDSMHDDLPVYAFVYLDQFPAPVGEESGYVSELYFRLEEA